MELTVFRGRSHTFWPGRRFGSDTVMMFSGAEIASTCPVRIRRRVNWGECDAAGVVYTPQLAQCVVESSLLFTEILLGTALQDRLREVKLALPVKGLTLDFKRGLFPEQLFDLTITVGEVRTRTFDLHVKALTALGEEVFDACYCAMCVCNETREAQELPESLRGRLQSHRDRCSP